MCSKSRIQNLKNQRVRIRWTSYDQAGENWFELLFRYRIIDHPFVHQNEHDRGCLHCAVQTAVLQAFCQFTKHLYDKHNPDRKWRQQKSGVSPLSIGRNKWGAGGIDE